MIGNIQLSDRSLTLLNRRQMSQDEIQQFTDLLNEAKSQQGSAIEQLKAMSAQELALLQKANSLADPINIAALSEEGAANLISQPDNSDKVDLNNDGIVEVGEGRSIVFPPVNAPDHVKAAWQDATAGLDETDKMMLELHMHIAVYGVQIEGVAQKTALPPEQQWSQLGIDKLFSDLRGNLEFRVGLEGWTEHNVMLRDFYDRFESSLDSSTSYTQQKQTFAAEDDKKPNEKREARSLDTSDKRLNELNQLLLDARMGIDRRKLEEIDEKMKAIESDSSLSSTQKRQMLRALEEQKEAIFAEAQRRTVENEKRKALLAANDNLTEQLQEELLKSTV